MVIHCRESAERELQAALQTTHSHACLDAPSYDTQEALTIWQAIIAGSSQMRQELREQVGGCGALKASKEQGLHLRVWQCPCSWYAMPCSGVWAGCALFLVGIDAGQTSVIRKIFIHCGSAQLC
jgi:hypothetical protein